MLICRGRKNGCLRGRKGGKERGFPLVILTKDVKAWEKKGKEKEKYLQSPVLEYGSYFFLRLRRKMRVDGGGKS